MNLHLDFETRCEADLPKVGLMNYVNHPTFKVLLTAWSEGDGDVHLYEGLPPLPWHRYLIHAFNAPFERAVLASQGVEPPASQFRCTMYHAYCRAFSGGLADVGEQVGIPKDRAKLATGSRLINKFCKPRKPSRDNPDLFWTPQTAPEEWELFKEYCRQDVVAERTIAEILSEWPLQKGEEDLWVWDQEVNLRGLPVDTAFAFQAARECDHWREEYLRELKAITGLANPNSRDQMLNWAREQGYPEDNLRADTVREYFK